MTSKPQSSKTDPVTEPKPKKRIWSILDSIARWALGILVAAACLLSGYEHLRHYEDESESAIEIVASNPSTEQDDGAADDSAEGTPPETLANTETEAEVAKPNRLSDSISMELIESADHPMDPLLTMADRGLKIVDSRYRDYSAKMVTQVRTGKTLHDENVMSLKLRHPRNESESDSAANVPFSIYTRFLKPKAKSGQEAIWVEGRDDDKILGHGTGLLNVKVVRLDPEGQFAMSGNRYPIYEIGFRNLVTKMKQFGENDRQYDECEVKIDRNVLVDDRPCTVITVIHPVQRDHFEYHIAKIYIDDEYEIPTGYEGYLWPETEGGEPVLLERYFYIDLKLNCDFEDIDFDITNPDYDYPSW